MSIFPSVLRDFVVRGGVHDSVVHHVRRLAIGLELRNPGSVLPGDFLALVQTYRANRAIDLARPLDHSLPDHFGSRVPLVKGSTAETASQIPGGAGVFVPGRG